MNKNTAAILVMVAAIAIAAGSALFLPRATPPFPSDTFVTVIDGKFTLAGRPYYFAGGNFWQGMNLGVDGPTGDRARLTAELDTLQQLGITNLRVMASSEGPDTEPYRILPSLMIAPGVYNQSVLDGLDFLVAEMGKRTMKAVMVLNNYWQWSGGMAQYVSWYEGTPIPYPGDYGTFMGYSARFYLCDECQTWYRHHIEMLINHTNPYTGLKYRDDPAVFAWELANEPRRYPDTWIDDTAAYIKSLDPNHMITTGSEGSPPGERQSFIEAHNGPNIAYTTVHIWPQNWGWYDPANPSTYASAQASALDYFRQLEDQSARLDKPLVLEEFGLARDYESVNDIFNSNSATTHRDLFYTAMFDAVYNSAVTGGSAAGFNFWAWAGHARPGDPWVGDPPHETPGWYSVYNTDDSTTNLITTYAEKMNNISAP
jgi:mannan endo-1,4-beta-mannosidase